MGLLQLDNELVAPELFWAEVGSVRRKKARAGERQDADAVMRLDALA
jgi:hypothetical protein